MNEPEAKQELTRSERLKVEIENIEAEIQKAIDDENKARNAQHWAKKRLKVAKDELTELSNA